jgi:hypothetical protein
LGVTPAGIERLFDEFSQIDASADKRDALRTLSRDVGMEVVGPPLAESEPLPRRAGLR